MNRSEKIEFLKAVQIGNAREKIESELLEKNLPIFFQNQSEIEKIYISEYYMTLLSDDYGKYPFLMDSETMVEIIKTQYHLRLLDIIKKDTQWLKNLGDYELKSAMKLLTDMSLNNKTLK